MVDDSPLKSWLELSSSAHRICKAACPLYLGLAVILPVVEAPAENEPLGRLQLLKVALHER